MSILDRDDESTDPRHWTWAKLCTEVEKGNRQAEAEYEDRIKELD